MQIPPIEVEVKLTAAPGLDALAAFKLFLDTAAIHRGEALERGFSPEAAEQMAVQLHSGLVALYFTSSDEGEVPPPPIGDLDADAIVRREV